MNPVTYYESFMPTIIAVQIGVRAHGAARPTRDRKGDGDQLRDKKITEGSSIGGIVSETHRRGMRLPEMRQKARNEKKKKTSTITPSHPGDEGRRSTATSATTCVSSARGFVYSDSRTAARAAQNLRGSRADRD